MGHKPPPLFRNRRPKIYYATQVAAQPPTVVLFCNNPRALSTQYQRYLLGVFRDRLEFGEVPIKLYLRKRESKDQRDDIDAKLKKSDPGNPEICNIYALHKLLSSQEEIDFVKNGCTGAKIGCIECKKILFENVEKLISPIRDKYHMWMSKSDEVREILIEGAKKANSVANETLNEVYELVGFRY